MTETASPSLGQKTKYHKVPQGTIYVHINSFCVVIRDVSVKHIMSKFLSIIDCYFPFIFCLAIQHFALKDIIITAICDIEVRADDTTHSLIILSMLTEHRSWPYNMEITELILSVSFLQTALCS